ncbi:SGNH/GDSL hydrolase family protein [Derxia gummosa]|uniref:SGNH/GDSL hydrolase family protein n=1 Tax=Derxia gummosa DSM 723 TaxID=1121388 RepID=A0A8B6X8K2_9BURK|nr:SGNH/GDSL hydrolase family protein [Derxia gummosa]
MNRRRLSHLATAFSCAALLAAAPARAQDGAPGAAAGPAGASPATLPGGPPSPTEQGGTPLPAAGPTPSPAPPVAPQDAPRIPAPPGTAPTVPAAAPSPAAVVRPPEPHCSGIGRPAPLGRLPITAARLAGREPLTIVALGSSTTAGAGATSIAATYPSRLGVELTRRLPGKAVRVINKGVNGQDVQEEVERFERDVFQDGPQLVIWQLGTNALLRELDFDSFSRLAEDGVARIRAHGIDLVLMDLQYAPRVTGSPGTQRMLGWFDRMAQREGVPVFRRFELMRQWAEHAGEQYASLLAPDSLHMNDESYACLAAALADAIVQAAAPPAGASAHGPGGRVGAGAPGNPAGPGATAPGTPAAR